MRIIALLGGLLCCAGLMSGQNLLTSGHQAAEGIVFELDIPTARSLASKQASKLSETWLQEVFTRFPSTETLPSELPPGQYITTRVIQNQLTWTYLQVPNCHVHVENDHARLMLKVLDLKGEVVTDALVKVGMTLLAYDPLTQTYTAKLHKDNQFVEIEVDGQVQFFDLRQATPDYDDDMRYRAPLWRRFAWNPFQRWVLMPVMLTMRLPYDLVGSIVKRRLFGWPSLIARRIVQVGNFGKHLAGGGNPVTFVVCSQPRYRPGDTVMVKAVLTNPAGNRIHGKVGVYLTDRAGREHLAAQMRRLGPGSYIAQFILQDSLNLQLDQDVQLSLRRGRIPKEIATTNFHYEDYELDEFTFALRLEASTHWKGKEAVAFLEAKDLNGLTVPDARARLSLLSRGVQEWHQNRLFVPDTIWSWKGNLDAAGETRIALPLDPLPAAALDYEIVAECWSSDNEYKHETRTLHYLYDQGEIKLQQKGMVLEASYWERGVAVPATATMSIRTGDLLSRKPQEVQLPMELPLSPAWLSVHLSVGRISAHWDSWGGPDMKVWGQHNGDSLTVSAVSAKGIPFTWHLLEGDREIASGPGPLHYHASAKSRSTYHLNVHGTFGGHEFGDDYSYTCPQNALTLTWEGPLTIYPGMTADMQVQVHDRHGRPVRKADLTAYAVNSRFEGEGSPNVSVRAAKVKARHVRRDFELKSMASNALINGQIPLRYSAWMQRARLDTLAWYQFLYPGNEIYTYSYPIETDHAEFAPFVVKDGAIQPVQIVYLDGDPVYFAWSNPAPPYAFWAAPDVKHRVEIRLPDGAVVLDSVRISKGFKTILSVDMAANQRNVQVRKLPKEVQPYEQNIISSHTFAYRNDRYQGPSLISFGPDRVFKLQYTSSLLCGPAKTSGQMTLTYANEYSHTINYEPNFEFDFGPKTVKMRTMVNGMIPKTCNYRAAQNVTDRPWMQDSIITQWLREKNRPQPSLELHWSQYSGLNYAKVLLAVVPQDPPRPAPLALILHDQKRKLVYVLRAEIGKELRLPLGKWGLHLQLDLEHFVALDSVQIFPNGRNFIRLDYADDAVQDSLPTLINKLIHDAPDFGMYNSPATYNAANGGGGFVYHNNRPASGRRTLVKGVVNDASTGEPLFAAMVYCEGYGVGTYTDSEGRFQLDAPVETDSILVRYLGYENQVIRWKGQPVLDVRMAESSIMLNEVLVQSERQRVDLTMNSASMDVIEIKRLSSVEIRGGRDLAPVMATLPGLQLGEEDDQMALVPAFPAELLAELGNESVMRKDFRDHAIWEPDLLTDKQGRSQFRVKFPEDITRWDAYAVAIDRRGRAGLTQAAIKAWKPLAGRLALPRFLMEGDTCLVIGKVLNYTGDTLSVRRRFQVNGRMQEHVGGCGPVQFDTLQLVAPRDADSLTVSYRADRIDGYGDGEERGIGIFPVGILDARGTMASLSGDTTLHLAPFAPDGGPVTLLATTKFQELLLHETQRLHDYNHLCNEQLSSKLIALLSEELIFKSMNRPWTGKKDVEICVKMLVKRIAPNDNGLSWGWWPGMPAEAWVSTHVTKALLQARAQGYVVTLQMLDWIPGLVNRLKLNVHHYGENIEVLRLIQMVAPDLDIRSKIEALDTLKLDHVTQKVAIMELRQKAGLPIDLDSLDRLISRMVNPKQSHSYSLSYATNYSAYQSSVYCPVDALLGAYRIKRRAGQNPTALAGLLMAILERRNYYGWANTFETAQVLLTLVPDIGSKAFTERPRVNLVIDGQRRSLPMDSTLVLAQPPTQISVEKTGYGLVFFTAYQRFFNRQPQPADSLFDIHTEFFTHDQLLTSDHIRAGEPLTMRVGINVKRDMDYLMVEVPIPAGCSYGPKTHGYASYGGYGMYREYFREKVACYYRQLNAGYYVIDIPLQPRYTGKYVLNCARAEQMYMPLLCGQNAVRKVTIE